MKIERDFHMMKGDDEFSYAENLRMQKRAVLATKPIVEKAVREVCIDLHPQSMVIADLGCSFGANTLLFISEMITTICQEHNNTIKESPMEIYNDFDHIFQSLEQFEQLITQDCACKGLQPPPHFIAGLPGSFCTRLFPYNSVHLFHSSMSFEKDFSRFLQMRCMEIVPGGRMVLTVAGRKSKDVLNAGGTTILFELLSQGLRTLVAEPKHLAAMKIERDFHMMKGDDEFSYAENLRMQKRAVLATKPIVEKAVREVCIDLHPQSMVIADLGCSFGANTLLFISEMITTICQEHNNTIKESPMEIYNDFDHIFQSLEQFEQLITQDCACKGLQPPPHFIAGLPGSFCTRLFPYNSVHLFHSSMSVMWLS
uniref:Uncharacterized protein n=1 Tax=Oryza meridionalis TaxID=40149 RepID=A0A0E0F4E6_9ORYZ